MCLSIIVDSPDRLLSEGEAHGFQWAVAHNTMGYRCGYIRLPKNHPWHGCDYNSIDASVHGGLTFSEPDKSCDAPGPDSGWWIGFDCSHAGDAPDPALLLLDHRPSLFSYGKIRTQEYVEEQCKQLCEQALAFLLFDAPLSSL
jgi:hypothetical protein